jgi:NADPH:quinone reductase
VWKNRVRVTVQQEIMMLAVTILDGRVQVREHPDPTPGFGQVLVRVRAAGLNGADIHQRSGHYPVPAGAPQDIPGLELAGEVQVLGPGVTRFKVGDRVMSLTAGGAQAQLALLHEREPMPVPARLSWAEAGALAEVFITAHDALFTQGRLAMSERLLVNGAAGGVGIAAVQLAVASSARVTASVRSETLRPAVESLGAHAIDPSETHANGPYDMILELVGATNLATNLASLAKGGRMALIGVSGGVSTAQFDFRALSKCNGTIFASSLRSRPLEQKADAARRLEAQVLPLFESGRLKVPLHAQFPLSAVASAYDCYQSRGKFGKVVLTMPD